MISIVLVFIVVCMWGVFWRAARPLARVSDRWEVAILKPLSMTWAVCAGAYVFQAAWLVATVLAVLHFVCGRIGVSLHRDQLAGTGAIGRISQMPRGPRRALGHDESSQLAKACVGALATIVLGTTTIFVHDGLGILAAALRALVVAGGFLLLSILIIGFQRTKKREDPAATATILRNQYAEFASIREDERLLKLFTTRPTWHGVPAAVLLEVIRRLETHDRAAHLEDVVEFIVVAEDCEANALKGGAIGNLRRAYPTEDLLELAGMSLLAYSNSLTRRLQSVAREYARRLAPDNPLVLTSLATSWYESGDYGRALEYCDRALARFEKMAYMKDLPAQLPETATRLKSEWKQMTDGNDAYVEGVRALRAECQGKLDVS